MNYDTVSEGGGWKQIPNSKAFEDACLSPGSSAIDSHKY
jgi:hypothetical protein